MSNNDWEIIDVNVDGLTNFISNGNGLVEVEVRNKEDNSERMVVVWNGDDKEIMQRVGEAITNGDFYDD